jgi:hypothetical protein
MTFRPALVLATALTACSLSAAAALSPDPSGATVRQLVLGIETPAEWASIPYQNIGSVVLTTRTSGAADGAALLSRRLDATLTMNSDRIMDDAVPATELTINITRNDELIAKCVLDLGHSLGSSEPQINDYHLVLTERSDAPFQAASGTCSTIDGSGAMARGIPQLNETDVVRLETTGLTLQSLVAAAQ